jgi:tetratricopeptide (TPR) repeat protein
MIVRDPRDPFHHWRLGAALERMKHTAAALDAYRDALKIDPKYRDARYSLAGLLYGTRQFDESGQCCRDGLELDPEDTNLSEILSNALFEMGKLDEAIAVSRAALKANPQDHVARHGLSSILLRARRWDEAAAFLEQEIKSEPNVPAPILQLGLVREAQGRLDEATAAYRRANELRPKFYGFTSPLALALARQGKLEEASKLLTDVADVEPKDWGSFYAAVACRFIKDGAGYDKVRKAMLDRNGKGMNLRGIDFTVKVWLLDPKVTRELPEFTAMAERAAIEGKGGRYYFRHQGSVEMTRGLVALRNREWEKAIEWCNAAPGHIQEAAPSHATGGVLGARQSCEAACRAIKAMAIHGQGGADRLRAAREELAAAEAILKENLDNPAMLSELNNFRFARILADEAAALLGETSFEPAPPPRDLMR